MKRYLIQETTETYDGDEYVDHVLVIAESEEQAIGIWEDQYEGHTSAADEGALPKFNIGSKTLAITSVKEINEEEYMTYAKVFKEIG
jgi:hypothetical protein